MKPLRIANAQAFWGDDSNAAARLAAQVPDLDFITLDYLAEVSMSILAKQREQDSSLGYARDFLDVTKSLTPFWQKGRKLRVVTNAGGLNPHAAAEACLNILRESNCEKKTIAVVSGDNVLPLIRQTPEQFRNLETGKSIDVVLPSLVTANAYLGAGSISAALRDGADLVITGRVADPSLTVGPCIAHFGWRQNDFDRIAGATIAGHLIECGTQVTGGISTDWLNLPNCNIGFPIAEVSDDGTCTITKPPNTGGRVSEQTVKEQLLYEIGDPQNYLSPDATVSFLSLEVQQADENCVQVSGAKGKAPTTTFKVSATFKAGYRATGTLTIFGRNAVAKARRCGEIIFQRLQDAGFSSAKVHTECLGSGDVVPGVLKRKSADSIETVLRISVFDQHREAVERFTREFMPLITAGPQGTTGYAQGRPIVQEVFGYWPTLIDRSLVSPQVELLSM